MAQCNTEKPRGTVLADANGQVFNESFSYLDEASGVEFDAEQYSLPDYTDGRGAGLVEYTNAPPVNDDSLDLLVSSGVQELVILVANEDEMKNMKKEKNFKKANKVLSKAGLIVDVVSLTN